MRSAVNSDYVDWSQSLVTRSPGMTNEQDAPKNQDLACRPTQRKPSSAILLSDAPPRDPRPRPDRTARHQRSDSKEISKPSYREPCKEPLAFADDHVPAECISAPPEYDNSKIFMDFPRHLKPLGKSAYFALFKDRNGLTSRACVSHKELVYKGDSVLLTYSGTVQGGPHKGAPKVVTYKVMTSLPLTSPLKQRAARRLQVSSRSRQYCLSPVRSRPRFQEPTPSRNRSRSPMRPRSRSRSRSPVYAGDRLDLRRDTAYDRILAQQDSYSRRSPSPAHDSYKLPPPLRSVRSAFAPTHSDGASDSGRSSVTSSLFSSSSGVSSSVTLGLNDKLKQRLIKQEDEFRNGAKWRTVYTFYHERRKCLFWGVARPGEQIVLKRKCPSF